MKPIHIVAGLLALLAGAMALYATKGSKLHRRAGMVFVAAMLAMSSTGAVMALVAKPNPVNVMAGATTFYLVATGWLAVKRTVAEARGWLIGFMLGALALSATAWGLGLRAIASPTGTIGGVTPGPIFMFAVVALAGGLLDARLLRAGHIAGGQRLARHLWRLGFAMWIATLSFFLGQADVFPEFLRQNVGLRAVPVLLVAGVVACWLVRVLRRRRAVLVQHTLGNP